MLWLGLLVGLGAYAAWTVSRCFFRVGEGHLAVRSTFGAAELLGDGSSRLRTWGPGLHTKAPWQHVIVVSMMEQSLDLSGETGGRTAMAEDGTILRFDSILRYVPVEAELARFLFGLRSPKDHITGLFTCLLRNEIANFRAPAPAALEGGRVDFALQAGSYALIRRERAMLNEHIERFCREQIGGRYGVRFNAVDLADILPPDEIADGLNAVIHARTDAEARFLRAEGECQQRLLASEKGVDIARARALAVETEIRTLAGHLRELAQKGTLDLYLARRREEVLSESRAVFVRGGA